MKEYQDLIGKIIIASAIIVSGILIARALSIGFGQLHDVIFMSFPK